MWPKSEDVGAQTELPESNSQNGPEVGSCDVPANSEAQILPVLAVPAARKPAPPEESLSSRF